MSPDQPKWIEMLSEIDGEILSENAQMEELIAKLISAPQ